MSDVLARLVFGDDEPAGGSEEEAKNDTKPLPWIDGVIEAVEEGGRLVWLLPDGGTAPASGGYSPDPVLRDLFDPPEIEEVERAYGKDLGPSLLRELEAFIADHVDLPDELPPLVVAAWVLHTWIHDQTISSPYLAVFGPYGSGKTRLLETLAAVSWRGFSTAALTPAVLFRFTDAFHPTLFIDESEHVSSELGNELAALLNLRYRPGAIIPRCRPKTFKLEFFKVYGPTAIAGTVARRSLISRAIAGTMAKTTRPLPLRVDRERARRLRAMCIAWRLENYVARIDDLPTTGDGRTVEILHPLLQVVALADPSRLRELEGALAAQISRREAEEGDSLEAELAEALVEIEPDEEGRITVVDVLTALGWDVDDRKDATRAGNLLKKSVGLRPCGRVRRGERRVTAYLWDNRRVARFIQRYVSQKRLSGCPKEGVFPGKRMDNLDGQPLDNLEVVHGGNGQPQVVDNLTFSRLSTPTPPLNWENSEAWTTCQPGQPPTVKGCPSPQPELEASEEAQASLEEAIPPGPPVVLAEKPFRIEWRPACRSLVTEAGRGMPPWEYLFSDRTMAHLPARGHYRLLFVAGDRCWWVDSDTFWARADIRPTGTVLLETELWRELVPAGAGGGLRTSTAPLSA